MVNTWLMSCLITHVGVTGCPVSGVGLRDPRTVVTVTAE